MQTISMNNKIKDLSNQRFYMVTVLDKYIKKDNRIYWYCKCNCGKIFLRRSDIIQNKQVKSCGCYQKINNTKIGLIHGDGRKNGQNHRLYVSWQGMLGRCYNSNAIQYKDWGGRGINVCDDWKNNYEVFKEWALNNGYKDNLTLDRIDVNGNYCPENCRWITKVEQNKNTRKCKHIEYNGNTYTIPELAKIFNISANQLRYWLFNKEKTIDFIKHRFNVKGGDME